MGAQGFNHQPTNRTNLQVSILTDDMDLAGDLLQDLAGYLGVEDLPSRANFPAALEAFKATLEQVILAACFHAEEEEGVVVGRNKHHHLKTPLNSSMHLEKTRLIKPDPTRSDRGAQQRPRHAGRRHRRRYC